MNCGGHIYCSDIKSNQQYLPMKKKKKTLKNPCWDNYEQLGMKNKNGKKVPNCIPKKKENNNH